MNERESFDFSDACMVYLEIVGNAKSNVKVVVNPHTSNLLFGWWKISLYAHAFSSKKKLYSSPVSRVFRLPKLNSTSKRKKS